MLYPNDIFDFFGLSLRLLHIELPRNEAWVIDLQNPAAWPHALPWSEIQSLPLAQSEDAPSSERTASRAMCKARDKAFALLQPLLHAKPAIFYPEKRGALVAKRAAEAGCTRATLYKHLRRYWVGGQTPAALLARFDACGTSKSSLTAGRGRCSTKGVPTYQVTSADTELFEKLISEHYLADQRVKIPATYQRLVEAHYTTLDGNGRTWLRGPGERPSARQFENYLRSKYPIEVRLRARIGHKDFERDHRAILGTVLTDCLGVGHKFEADATIADVYLVATDDIRDIIGKPTLYFIIDRKSRLIVGWYIGLENPSWVCAQMAILSIAQDKRTLCEEVGVAYDPEDWPAHQLFPREFLADRGELLANASNRIADDLEITVTNLPSKRPDWKPVVECGFKLIRCALEDGTPGFDPPENAKKRQGRHYEKDACLTLRQFTAIVLSYIIEHNRAPMRNYDLSLQEMADKVRPTPIELWNHGVQRSTGLLTRYSEERVRHALLPQDQATVTEFGIEFRGCVYSCDMAVQRRWFEQARRSRFKVRVAYDLRLVDRILLYSDTGRREVFDCLLTSRSQKYAGMSFAQVKALQVLQAKLAPQIEQARLQARADRHQATAPILEAAKSALVAARRANTNGKLSRSARRADTKEARLQELQRERQSSAPLRVVPTAEPISQNIFPLAVAQPAAAPVVDGTPSTTRTSLRKNLAALQARIRTE